MRTNYEETWDLDVFFSGGSESPQFAKHLQSLRKQLSQFEEDVKNWEVPTNENDTSLLGLLEKIQKIHDNMGQAGEHL